MKEERISGSGRVFSLFLKKIGQSQRVFSGGAYNVKFPDRLPQLGWASGRDSTTERYWVNVFLRQNKKGREVRFLPLFLAGRDTKIPLKGAAAAALLQRKFSHCWDILLLFPFALFPEAIILFPFRQKYTWREGASRSAKQLARLFFPARRHIIWETEKCPSVPYFFSSEHVTHVLSAAVDSWPEKKDNNNGTRKKSFLTVLVFNGLFRGGRIIFPSPLFPVKLVAPSSFFSPLIFSLHGCSQFSSSPLKQAN